MNSRACSRGSYSSKNRHLPSRPQFGLLLFTALLLAPVLHAQPPAEFLLAERGPNHRTWIAPPDSATGQHEPRKIVELRSGMHYWDPARSDWAESEPVFTETPEGFTADRIQHAARLAPDIYVTGALAFRLPESRRLVRATPVGIGPLQPHYR